MDHEEPGSSCRQRRICSASMVQGEPRKGQAMQPLTTSRVASRSEEGRKATALNVGRRS